MPDKTKIEWTDATWNPIRGCSRVSEGCRNCYAEKIAARFSCPGQAFEGLAQMKDGEARWTGKIAVAEDALDQPLHWRSPRRIFVNSMSDLFHDGVSAEALSHIFEVMLECPKHTFQILTKRPERAKRWFDIAEQEWNRRPKLSHEFPWRNIWLGVSVEDQDTAAERIPILLDTPAAVRFISYEPAIAQMKLKWEWVSGGKPCGGGPQVNLSRPWEPPTSKPKLDWVICGGESGPGARPLHPAWADHLCKQCESAGIPFFFKQWGEWAPLGHFTAPANRLFSQRIELDGYTFLKAGKKIAGRKLAGVEYNEFPTAREAHA
jgi:protein gp37